MELAAKTVASTVKPAILKDALLVCSMGSTAALILGSSITEGDAANLNAPHAMT